MEINVQSFCRICFKRSSKFFDFLSCLSDIQKILRVPSPMIYSKKCMICEMCFEDVRYFRKFLEILKESNQKFLEYLRTSNLPPVEIFERRQTKIVKVIVKKQQKDASTSTDVERIYNDSDCECEDSQLQMFVEEIVVPPPSLKPALPTPPKITMDDEKVKRLKSDLIQKITKNAAFSPCALCHKTESHNDLKPYRKTLTRILPDKTLYDSLCNSCLDLVKEAEKFYAKFDKSLLSSTVLPRDACSYCRSKTTKYPNKKCSECIKSLEIVELIQKGSENVEEFDKEKERKKQKLISKIMQDEEKEIVSIKENLLNFLEKTPPTTSEKSKIDTKQTPITQKNDHEKQKSNTHNLKIQVINYEDCFGDEPFDKNEELYISAESDNENTYEKSKTSKNRRYKIRAIPKYVLPDPDQPIPEDYDCHMSDFYESDSDYDLPSTAFSQRLNVPFTEKSLQCPKCFFKSVNSYEMEAHQNVMHDTTGLECDLCEDKKVFGTLEMLRRHKLKEHFWKLLMQKGFLCEICGQSVTPYAHEEHMAKHTRTKLFFCDKCTFSTFTKLCFKHHYLNIHCGQKLYKCKYCDKRFSYSSDAMRHEIAVHTKKFKHICTICNRNFVKKNFLTAHMKSQHSDLVF